MKKIGAVLKDIREDNNFLLKDLAKELDCSVSHISSLEVGRNSFPLEWVDKLVDFWKSKGVEVDKTEMVALAYIHNGYAPITQMPFDKQLEVAMIAASINAE